MQVLILPENKEINYIKTVQEVKRFFEDFQRFRVIAGLSKKPFLLRDGLLEEPHFGTLGFSARHNKEVIMEARWLVEKYTATLNQMDGLDRNILLECYVERKQDVAVMMDLPYEIAQFKRIKKRAVLELATIMGILVRK
ncbi:ArpU family phage packaging/lysis transcriptional regulator [Listeria swaminathanii]|uniref:ArpU family phage packaging/lysis transcriptional regulator n=1 Tax=Listeria swaminathanii TaxID=2713501 RepID=A0ABU2IHD5_9LIST|nr:ArpU family phage packaging/lysis transcriptional regulator [Listeria swaminathanii]UHP10330.1 hypothetical protein LAX80_000605 [Listeria marthii]MDT0017381.1 ArpU family phage packaging/lysis transcriptional regulator [Listeria swaminathanii]MDT0023335.1 ArpU family phage packaging/lysis transcriptional regulator [Listeria swaminathanii]MDT0034277.1 ArpU family phage packaging/lysis transcriptional regulator [Listeria swaminathanii]MDT0053100.1 ArpU family phage packaging/lysis transcript